MTCHALRSAPWSFMQDIEIRLPKKNDCDKAARAIDCAIEECNLTITMRDTLKKFPGCIHWHVKNLHDKSGAQSGTLEITMWPAEHRAWFTIQSGRICTVD